MSDSTATVAADGALTQIRHLVLTTQAVFFASLAWCYIIEHGPVVQIDGISYYGIDHRTLPILFLGYFVAAIGLWRTGDYLRSGGASEIVWIGLRVVGLSLMVLLAAPLQSGNTAELGSHEHRRHRSPRATADHVASAEHPA